MPKIEVCKGCNAYFLKIFFKNKKGDNIKMETDEIFDKKSADKQAILLSMEQGWEIDELPTHSRIIPHVDINFVE